MTPEIIVDLIREALALIILMVCIMVLPSLLVGLIVSVFQAATQINEQTLSFLPRLLTTFLSIMLAGPFLLSRITDFTQNLMLNIPLLIG